MSLLSNQNNRVCPPKSCPKWRPKQPGNCDESHWGTHLNKLNWLIPTTINRHYSELSLANNCEIYVNFSESRVFWITRTPPCLNCKISRHHRFFWFNRLYHIKAFETTANEYLFAESFLFCSIITCFESQTTWFGWVKELIPTTGTQLF